jgi:hypothetical protein
VEKSVEKRRPLSGFGNAAARFSSLHHPGAPAIGKRAAVTIL